MSPSFAIEVETVTSILDQLDYFQILKIPPTATEREIKAAYFREARIFHPDRSFHLQDATLGERLLTIHKRITEAYTVLRDESSRRGYLARIQGPERELHLRWRVEDAPATQQEEVGTTDKGRKLFGAALVDLQGGRLDAAERNLKMALVFEPQNAHFRQKLDEVETARKASLQEGSRAST